MREFGEEGGVRVRSTQTRRRKKNQRSGLYMVVVVIMLMLGTLSMKMFTLDANCQKLADKKIELETRKENLLEEKDEIQKKAEYMKTTKYIEDIAREKLGLVYKDEIIFKASK